jgi:hypothetical protein
MVYNMVYDAAISIVKKLDALVGAFWAQHLVDASIPFPQILPSMSPDKQLEYPGSAGSL